MNISSDKLEEFTVLFEEFINSYPNTSKGIKHISSYSQQRESGRRNYQAILEAKEAGEDITDRVLLQLLPYRDTKNNREQGAWIHTSYLTPSVLKNVQDKIRLISARSFIRIINVYIKNPGEISNVSAIINNYPVTKNLLVDFISPILNALQPRNFMLINKKSISVINYFTNTKSVINYFTNTNNSHKLIYYPAINKLAWQLIKDLSSIMDRFDLPALPQDDLFNMFCHWLVMDKKYNFKAGLEKSDRNSTDVINLINKSMGQDIEFSEPEIHPDSCLSEEGVNLLDGIWRYGLDIEIDRIGARNYFRDIFIRLCNEIKQNLPSYIKHEINSFNTTLNINTLDCINCELRYKLSIPYLRNSIDFKLYLEFTNVVFICNIFASLNIDDNCPNNALIRDWLLIKYDKNLQLEYLDYEISQCLNKKINITDYLDILQQYYPISFTATNTEDILGLDLKARTRIEKVIEQSNQDLVNDIIEVFNYFYLNILVLFSENPKSSVEEHLRIWNPKYKLEKYVDATYIEESQLKTWIKSITRKKQAIFYGSPGTGKTFIAENIAQYLIGGGDGFYELIQFHPAYSYEDFIQGIRPQTKDSGQLSYNLVPGRFLQFCNKAAECQDKCILIIDEINRANLAEVFGELMYLLEYREQEICLAGSQEKFKIPDNVYLIGTMNTADRSIALVDFALRRRFAFIKIAPNYDIITKFHQQRTHLEVTGLITVLREINNLIEDENYYLGISFFLIETLTEDLENIWQMEIEPYLEEYFFDRLDEITDYQWKNIKNRILPISNSIES